MTSALLDLAHLLQGRARGAGEQRLRWARASALLLAGACGGSEGSGSAPPLPSEAPDAVSVSAAPPPASNDAMQRDAGAREPTSSELLPSGGAPPPAAPPPPAQPEPANDSPARGGAAAEVDLDLACSAGPQTICLDDARVVICQSGQPIETSCDTLCENYGLNPGPCDGGCQCGEPSSPQCVLASEDFCACSALVGSGECTPETRDRLYLGCYVNGIAGELMACTAEFRAARPDAPLDEAFCTDLNETCQ